MMGFGLSILDLVGWGTDTFTFMNFAICDKIGISIGNWQLLINIVMFIPVILWARHMIGIGTVFNMVIVGYSVQFFSWVWTLTPMEIWLQAIPLKVLFMLPSIAILIFFAAIYMTAGLGTAPFDAIPFLISRKLPRIPFRYVRAAWDVLFILLGLLLGGKLGIVTILMAIFVGPVVAFVGRKLFGKEA